MVERKIYQVPDIKPVETEDLTFVIEVKDEKYANVVGVTFQVSVDGGQSEEKTTDDAGIIKTSTPLSDISISLPG